MKPISLTALFLTAILFCFAGRVTAQPATANKTTSQGVPLIVLRAARMLDVQTGRIVSPAVIVVEKDRIKSVNPATVPSGQLIDLGNVTLLPGLIDMHTHLSFDIEGNWFHRAVTDTAGDFALRGARNARKTLLAGFTTVRDVGSADFVDVALMRAIDQDFIPGPRMFPAGHSIGITGGHCDTTGYAPGVLERGPESGVADGPEAALKAVRYQIKHGAKVIKVCATAGVLSLEGPVGAQQLSEVELRTIVEEAAPRAQSRRTCARRGRHHRRGQSRCCLNRARFNPQRRSHQIDEGAWHLPGAHNLSSSSHPSGPPTSSDQGQSRLHSAASASEFAASD